VTEPRWYCVSKYGMATLCRDDKDAKRSGKRFDLLYPQHAPHRAMQLIDAAEVARLRAEVERLTDMLTKARDGLSGGLWDYGPGQDEHEQCNALIAEIDAVLK
jgi:hypothetical protein